MISVADVCQPVPTNASKVLVHQFAERIGKQLGFNPGDALEPLVARLGGRVLYHSPSHLNGAPESIVVSGNRDFSIYIPTTTSPQRDRFTIGHELGHVFLHYPMVQKDNPGKAMVATRWVDPSDYIQQRAEWEANWFAAGFLMPEFDFRQKWISRKGEIALISSDFGVSEQAAKVRAQTLGLV